MTNMKSKWFAGMIFILGLASGVLITRLYQWNLLVKNQRDRSTVELSTQPEQLDWTRGVGPETTIYLKSFLVGENNKILHGPSVSWVPATHQKRIVIYNHGETESVQSSSREY